ncbi:MAG: succinate dehydrogenase assembly factor 2 [Pseudomonadota bacterium]
MGEDLDTARRRLAMRSMRRGIKEMDLILSAYADAHLPKMGADELAQYDALLSENDQDLYTWVTGQVAPPPEFEGLISDIGAHFRP